MSHHRFWTVVVGLSLGGAAAAAPMGTSFTYQGQLKHNGAPVDGPVNIQFRLWSEASGGSNLATYGPVSVNLTNGLFATQVDFGDQVFSGAALWIEVRIEYPAGTWTSLNPRQQITPTPYAIRSARAENLVLPYTATVSTSQSAVALTQTGTGRAATFSAGNAGSDEPTLYVFQNGIGPGGEFFINSLGNSEPAVLASSIGTGPGVQGKNFSSGPAVEGNAWGSGRAASFLTELSGNSSPTIYAEQKGTGRCAHFRITNASNDTDALAASTTGDGVAVSGYTIGENAAGKFEINNSVSDASAVIAKTNGSGYAIEAQSTNDVGVSGGGAVVIGATTGINVALDGNEIMARNNGATSTLFVNNDGGDVYFGGAIDIGYEIVSNTEGDTDYAVVHCPAGKKVLGGGCWSSTDANYLQDSYPITDGVGWACQCRYSTVFISVYAICARVK